MTIKSLARDCSRDSFYKINAADLENRIHHLCDKYHQYKLDNLSQHLVSDSLLKKYMTAIIAEEGVSFIPQIETPFIDHAVSFNQEEIDKLKKIESDIENDR